MCGIAGIFGIEDKSALYKMMQSIKHRGPDDRGIYLDNNVSIGHLRLSIIDLSKAGRNPLFNEDESVFVVFNGEIYNFRSLRKDLEKLGHQFSSRTDSEVIVHAYEEWGIECVKKFNGMFAFALFDIGKNKLFLCRDQFGIKPLFYSVQNKILFFSSEIRALMESGYIEPEINKFGLYTCLSFFCTPSPITIYKGIKKIPPGYYLEINSNFEIKITKYYDINLIPNNFNKNISQIIKEGEFLLRNSIDRMRYSDVPQGVFLSGGIDSSAIVALLNEMESNPIETFSIGIEGYGENFNELKYAQLIHETFDTNHHEYLIDAAEIPHLLESYINEQYDFIADPACVLTYKLSKEAYANKIKVLHVGEGADEIYCGYNIYFDLLKNYNLRYKYNLLPNTIKNSFNLSLKKGFKVFSNLLEKDAKKFDFFYSTIGTVDRLSEDWYVPERGIMGFSEFQKNYFLRENLIPTKNSKYNINNIIKINNRNTSGLNREESYLQDMRFLEFKIRLPELILMRVDQNTMLSSVEARVPYFDLPLLEYSMSLCPPLKIHYKNFISKYILRKIMQDKLPKEILFRKKIGLTTPVFYEKSLNFSDIIEREFSRSYLKQFFKVEFLDKIVRNKKFKKNFSPTKLWQLLSFCFLYRKVILGEKIIF